jgi:hypothetical protein
MKTRESLYTCCNCVALRWDHERQQPIGPSTGVRREGWHWLFSCPFCRSTKDLGEVSPLSLS